MRVVSLAWACQPTRCRALLLKALDPPLEQRGRPDKVMFHSDQGPVRNASSVRLLEVSLQQSMSRRGNWWDNAPMERLFRSLENRMDTKRCLFGYRNHGPRRQKRDFKKCWDYRDELTTTEQRPHDVQRQEVSAVAARRKTLKYCPAIS